MTNRGIISPLLIACGVVVFFLAIFLLAVWTIQTKKPTPSVAPDSLTPYAVATPQKRQASSSADNKRPLISPTATSSGIKYTIKNISLTFPSTWAVTKLPIGQQGESLTGSSQATGSAMAQKSLTIQSIPVAQTTIASQSALYTPPRYQREQIRVNGLVASRFTGQTLTNQQEIALVFADPAYVYTTRCLYPVGDGLFGKQCTTVLNSIQLIQ